MRRAAKQKTLYIMDRPAGSRLRHSLLLLSSLEEGKGATLMDKIAEWLASLGLGQYAQTFAENEIDESLLYDISDQILKDVGIAVAGHRMKILRSIVARKAATTPLEAIVATAHPTVRATSTVPERGRALAASPAERRQLTVMFCDLIGSTALAARLDPEDLREVVRAYQSACARVISRYEGFVAQYLGDGIMAYFGYPNAHEDDAERAVRAGLDLIAAVTKLDTKSKVKVRLGIATGLVIVGDLIGEHAAKERAVTGETPNLAARLQGLASAGSIVVSAATRRLLGGQFALRDLGAQEIKGLDAPVSAFAVEGLHSFESRFEARAGGLTGFVGREEECDHLLARRKLAWQQGRGQMVALSGEAGIGKSRLIEWLVEKVAAEPHRRVRYQCTPHHRNSSLYPFASQIERAAGIELSDIADTKLSKLEAGLTLTDVDGGVTVSLFAALLAVPTGGHYPLLDMSPGEQRLRTMHAMLDQIEALAKQHRLLLIYEDAHWGDPTSLELLEMLVGRVERLPVLCIVTTRPEFSPAWVGRDNASTIELNRLDTRSTRAMIESVTGKALLDASVVEQIVRKTDGVPLFVEELTKAVIEATLPAEGDHGKRGARAPAAVSIPESLQDSLMARLDRLNPVKDVAQVAAAIGREFSYRLLAVVAGMDETTVKLGLARLEEAELATRRGIPPDAIYTFKHALVQDAAYESLLRSRRQTIHQRIAKTLRNLYPDVADGEPETIAHHFQHAGKAWQSVDWWKKAGDLANRRGAYVEALGHYSRAVELADGISLDPTQLRFRLELQIAYRNALFPVYGWAAPQTVAAFTRSAEFAALVDDPAEQMAGAFGPWMAALVRGEASECLRLVKAYHKEVAERDIELERFTADNIVGQSLWACGDFKGAVAAIELALATYERQKYLPWFGADGVTIGLSYLALSLWPLGRIAEAHATVVRAADHAASTGNLQSIVFAQGFEIIFDAVRGDTVALKQSSNRTIALASKHDMKFWVLIGNLFLALSEIDAIGAQAAISTSNTLIDILLSLKTFMMEPLQDGLQASLHGLVDDAQAGIRSIDDILNKNVETGQTYFDAELHRRKGVLLLEIDKAAAEDKFQSAIAVARAQHAAAYELKACLELSRLYRDSGRESEARDVLAPAVVGFTKTASFPELCEAQGLLTSLGGAAS